LLSRCLDGGGESFRSDLGVVIQTTNAVEEIYTLSQAATKHEREEDRINGEKEIRRDR
jgi:hypothetical protein